MYETFFGMNRRPFAALPQVDQYVAVGAIEQARSTLTRCVLRAEGIAMVVGPSGTGKTLLGLLLAAELGMQMRVVALPGGRFTSPRALYQALLYELGKAYRGLDESEARLALNDYLLRDDDCSAGVLVLVDDAQCVGLRLLDELRALTNLGRAGLPLVRLVLIGNRLLEERLSHPRLESLSQRVTARCYLESLPRHETQQYIQTRVGYAGGNGPALFPEAACAAVHRATDGVARLVNQVCDHALLLAAARGQSVIDPALVEEAWADLQQLPTPWNEDSSAAPVSNSIEFGALNDDEPLPSVDAMPSRSQPTTDQANLDDSDNPLAAEDDSGWFEPSAREPAAGPDEPSREAKDFAAFSPPPAASPELSAESFLDDDEDAAMRAEQEVDRIETYLSEVDDQFRPSGPKPEVELVFDTAHQPFAEPFAYEEEVPDRYVPRPHRSAARQSPEPAESAESASQPPPTVPIRPRTDRPDSVLIVEEGYGDPTPTPPCRVRPVRRNELADLFTRLRRGQ